MNNGNQTQSGLKRGETAERKQTTGTISLEYKADKKAARSGERGIINQTCFCIIGDVCFSWGALNVRTK